MCCSLTAAAKQRFKRGLLSVGLILFGLQTNVALAANLQLDKLRLPPGFHIAVLTDAVPNARQMALGRYADGRGVLYVGSMGAGNVYAVELDQGRAKAVHIIASGLPMPVGVAYRDGRLYVSAVSRILRLDGIDDRLSDPPAPVVVTDRFPGATHHGWKFIAFGPDGWLYVPVGAPCNICDPDARFANIQRMKPDGSAVEMVARGVRNSVGFDWNPTDHSLWFTDNGRDMMGDDLPVTNSIALPSPVSISAIRTVIRGIRQTRNSGASESAMSSCRRWPSLGHTLRPLACASTRANNSRMRTGTTCSLPNTVRGTAARKLATGLSGWCSIVRGVSFSLSPSLMAGCKRDASGKESVWGRPVDVLVMPDGSLLISDDLAGAIYRVWYAP